MQHFNGMDIDGAELFRIVNGTPVSAGRNATSTANTFEQQVLQVLIGIQANVAGAALLTEIRATGRGLTIVPVTGPANAFALAAAPGPLTVANMLQAERDRTARGAPVFRHGQAAPQMEPGDDPTTLAVEAMRPIRGFGTGSDTRVFFSPGNVAAQADSAGQMLLHELVHAMRSMKGHFVANPTNDPFVNDEEFIAIVVEDIFQSVAGRISIRTVHTLPGSMRGVLQTVAGQAIVTNPFRAMGSSNSPAAPTLAQTYARDHHRQLQTFVMHERNFAYRLGQIQCDFNPVREYLIGIGAIRR